MSILRLFLYFSNVQADESQRIIHAPKLRIILADSHHYNRK